MKNDIANLFENFSMKYMIIREEVQQNQQSLADIDRDKIYDEALAEIPNFCEGDEELVDRVRQRFISRKMFKNRSVNNLRKMIGSELTLVLFHLLKKAQLFKRC